LELQVELLEPPSPDAELPRTDDPLVIGEIEAGKEVELLDHRTAAIAPRGLDVPAESVTVPHGRSLRQGGEEPRAPGRHERAVGDRPGERAFGERQERVRAPDQLEH